jgi:endonuclease YncB( thermonuclease family)
MKYLIALLCLLAAFISCAEEVLKGKVIRVSDGDTIVILTESNRQVKIRLHGIDCPESQQDFGTRAKQFTAGLVFAKTVKVEVLNEDRYGRSIGLITLPDGRLLNKELLKAGLAWHYKKHDQSKEFAELEDNARSKKIGIWSMSNAVAPWEFRKAKRR